MKLTAQSPNRSVDILLRSQLWIHLINKKDLSNSILPRGIMYIIFRRFLSAQDKYSVEQAASAVLIIVLWYYEALEFIFKKKKKREYGNMNEKERSLSTNCLQKMKVVLNQNF